MEQADEMESADEMEIWGLRWKVRDGKVVPALKSSNPFEFSMVS